MVVRMVDLLVVQMLDLLVDQEVFEAVKMEM